MQTVKDIMTRDVMTVRADWSVNELAEFLADNSISGAPVVTGEDELVGVVSVTDIVRHSGSPVSDHEHHVPHDVYSRHLERQYAQEELRAFRIEGDLAPLVSEIMTPMVFDVFEATTLEEVADTMVRGGIHRVFVTRDKQVVGVVSALDMLKVAFKR